ncbi:hypothetical protein ACE41A_15545 [Bacillus cytotoxicus]|uniref:DUF7852 domain-containing protein n=1 Tax=Bacillus cytotoxicus TaxID=580165 RepID=UPI0035C9B228
MMNKPWMNYEEMSNIISKQNAVYKVIQFADKEMYPGCERYSKFVKTPFSIMRDIKDFLMPPIINVVNEEMFVYKNQISNERDSRLVMTIQQYNEQPHCYLKSTKIVEDRSLIEVGNDFTTNNINTGKMQQSSLTSLHQIVPPKENEEKNLPFLATRLPVLLGDYKIELALEEMVIFPGKVEIRGISKNIVVTSSGFIPKEKLRAHKYVNKMKAGKLWIEGYVLQQIDYKMHSKYAQRYQMKQKMFVELRVQLLQKQEVQLEDIKTIFS